MIYPKINSRIKFVISGYKTMKLNELATIVGGESLPGCYHNDENSYVLIKPDVFHETYRNWNGVIYHAKDCVISLWEIVACNKHFLTGDK